MMITMMAEGNIRICQKDLGEQTLSITAVTCKSRSLKSVSCCHIQLWTCDNVSIRRIYSLLTMSQKFTPPDSALTHPHSIFTHLALNPTIKLSSCNPCVIHTPFKNYAQMIGVKEKGLLFDVD
jgi:hypothetical protein